MASTPSKTVQTALIAWQDIASAAEVISSAFDCSSKWAGACDIRIGRRTGSAFTAGSPNIRIEASIQTTNKDWTPIFIYQPIVGTNIANTTLNGAVTAGASTFVVTSATNIAVGDILFLGDASAANYELIRVKVVSGTTITPEDVLLFDHANAAIVTDQAEMALTPALDLSCYNRIRTVVDNLSSGQNISVQVTLVTFDSF